MEGSVVDWQFQCIGNGVFYIATVLFSKPRMKSAQMFILRSFAVAITSSSFVSVELRRNVNNSAILATETSQLFEDTSLPKWQEVQSVNSEGVFLGCKYGVEEMRETGRLIINLSSIAGLISCPHLVAYGALKDLVRQLSKSIAVHCGHEGYRIRCNSIHPGIIQTKMRDQMVTLNGCDISKIWIDRINLIPLGEVGTAEDITNGALFLASDEARHITGAELVIDGGMTII